MLALGFIPVGEVGVSVWLATDIRFHIHNGHFSTPVITAKGIAPFLTVL
jgi:hypothetical protein